MEAKGQVCEGKGDPNLPLAGPEHRADSHRLGLRAFLRAFPPSGWPRAGRRSGLHLCAQGQVQGASADTVLSVVLGTLRETKEAGEKRYF